MQQSYHQTILYSIFAWSGQRAPKMCDKVAIMRSFIIARKRLEAIDRMLPAKIEIDINETVFT